MHFKTKRSPLHTAVVEEKIEDVSSLIKQGANVNALDADDVTPLHLAVETRNTSIMKLLLDAGAQVNVKICDNDRSSPLYMSIRSNNESVVKCIIESMSDINSEDEEGYTALHSAAMWGNSKILKLVLDAGANVNGRDYSEKTPLLKACESTDNVNILKLLIDAGADVNAKDESNYTPLQFAVESKNVSITKFLLNAGANVNAKDNYGSTPVHDVAQWGCLDVFKLLIGFGGDINVANDGGNTPLFNAIRSRNLPILEALIDSGANVNTINSTGYNPLHVAIESRQIETFSCLIEAGTDINAKDGTKQNTPLHLAARFKNVDVLQLLIHAGAKVNEYNADAETPLTIFMKRLLLKKQTESKDLYVRGLKLLIECTDVNLVDKDGENILAYFLKSDTFLPVRKFVYKIMLKHVAILKTLDLPLDERLLKTISQITDFKNYFVICTNELKKAKSTRLQNCWVNFFNLLVEDKTKLVKYAGNSDLIKGLMKCMNDFPVYGSMMQNNLSKGIIDRELYEGAANMLSNHLPIFDSFHLIIRDTLNSLCQQDWEKLLRRKRFCE